MVAPKKPSIDRSKEVAGDWVDTRPPSIGALREALPSDARPFAHWLQGRLERYWVMHAVADGQPSAADEIERCRAFAEAANVVRLLLQPPTIIGPRANALIKSESVREGDGEHAGEVASRVGDDLSKMEVWVEKAAKRISPSRAGRKSPRSRDLLIFEIFQQLSTDLTPPRRYALLADFLEHNKIATLTKDGVRDAVESGRKVEGELSANRG